MKFEIEDTTKIENWINTHDCKFRTSDYGIENEIYVGAIGGAITYEFTPTGLGTAIVISCACGKELNITDYGSW